MRFIKWLFKKPGSKEQKNKFLRETHIFIDSLSSGASVYIPLNTSSIDNDTCSNSNQDDTKGNS